MAGTGEAVCYARPKSGATRPLQPLPKARRRAPSTRLLLLMGLVRFRVFSLCASKVLRPREPGEAMASGRTGSGQLGSAR